MYSAGRFRHRIVIEKPAYIQNLDTGDMVPTWEAYATRWAEIAPSSGNAFMAAKSEQSQVTGRIVMRAMPDLTADMRILHTNKGITKVYEVAAILPDADSGEEYISVMVKHLKDLEPEPSPYSPQALALFARMDEQLSDAQKVFINEWLPKANPYLNKLDWFYTIISDRLEQSLSGGKVLCWNNPAYDADMHGFINFEPNKGLKGDGATFYMDTHFLPNSGTKYKVDSVTIGAVMTDTAGTATLNRTILGYNSVGVSNTATRFNVNSGGANQAVCRINRIADRVYTYGAMGPGHITGTRNGNAIRCFRDTTTVDSFNSDAPAPIDAWTSGSFYLMAQCNPFNTATPISQFSFARFCCFFGGGGLSDDECNEWYYILNELLAFFGAEDQKFKPVANSAIGVNVAKLTQNTVVTYTLTRANGTTAGEIDIEQLGSIVDSDFNTSFIQSLTTAAAANVGVSFDGVKKLTFTNDFSGVMSWTRTYTSNNTAVRNHIVRLSNANNSSIWQPAATALSGNPVAVNHPRLLGWNNSGFEFDMTLPPSDWTFSFARNKGFNCMRIPYKIERVQPTPYGEINGPDAIAYKNKVQLATSLGFYVILDPHNFAAVRVNGVSRRIGTPEYPVSAYVDHIVKMNAYMGNDAKFIWCLMNEPVGVNQRMWFLAAQTALDALRVAGFYGDVQVPGTGYTGAHSWISSGNSVYALSIKDALNNYTFDVHQYYDADSSGTNGVCVLNSQTRLDAVTAWAIANNKKLFLGETASGNPNIAANADCATVFPLALSKVAANSVWNGVAGWGYGDRWPQSYPFTALQANISVDPDTPYMDMMENAIASIIG